MTLVAVVVTCCDCVVRNMWINCRQHSVASFSQSSECLNWGYMAKSGVFSRLVQFCMADTMASFKLMVVEMEIIKSKRGFYATCSAFITDRM